MVTLESRAGDAGRSERDRRRRRGGRAPHQPARAQGDPRRGRPRHRAAHRRRRARLRRARPLRARSSCPTATRRSPCDTVVLAVGQMADLGFLGADHGLQLSPQGLIAVDPATLATSRAGVFAGGDIAFGPRIVISAVADGRRAARAIDTHLTGRRDEPVRYRLRVFPTFGYEHPFARGDYETVPRAEVPVIPVERRTGAAEVERVLSDEEARAEGTRCLHCWVNTVFDSSRPSTAPSASSAAAASTSAPSSASTWSRCAGCRRRRAVPRCACPTAARSSSPASPARRSSRTRPCASAAACAPVAARPASSACRRSIAKTKRRCAASPTRSFEEVPCRCATISCCPCPKRSCRGASSSAPLSGGAFVLAGLGTAIAALKFLDPPRAVRRGHARHHRHGPRRSRSARCWCCPSKGSTWCAPPRASTRSRRCARTSAA